MYGRTTRYLFVLFVSLFFFAVSAAPVLADGRASIGAVYTMTNSAHGNHILIFARQANGKLKFMKQVPTGGLGTGSGLGNQGAVILDPANRWLFAVNPGSHDISVFKVRRRGLTLIETVASGGTQPVSLTYANNVLYVLNAGGGAGGEDSIAGFHVGPHGHLAYINGSSRPLSGASTAPAQVQFNSDGDLLVVTEKATNIIDTYKVDSTGLASGPRVQASAGMTPFGFAFGKRDQLFVSEAVGGAADASSVSAYSVSQDGTLLLIDGSVATTETAACWVVVTNDGRFAYTTNAGSGTVSGYKVAFDGRLRLLDRNGVTGRTGHDSAPIDMALSNDQRNLYTLNSGNSTISTFRVRANGMLIAMRVTKLPPGANGLAAR